jgi:hypothetical protein
MQGNGCWVWLPDWDTPAASSVGGLDEQLPGNCHAQPQQRQWGQPGLRDGGFAPPHALGHAMPGAGWPPRAGQGPAAPTLGGRGPFAESLLDVLAEAEGLEAGLRGPASSAPPPGQLGGSWPSASGRGADGGAPEAGGPARRQLYTGASEQAGVAHQGPPWQWQRGGQPAGQGHLAAAWVAPPVTALDDDDLVSLMLNSDLT